MRQIGGLFLWPSELVTWSDFGKLPVQIGVSYQWVVKHPADIEHQDSIVRLTFTPVIPSPFAKKE